MCRTRIESRTPLLGLLKPGAVQYEERTADGTWVKIKYFDVAGARLWGATAMMTAELLTLLGWPGPRPAS